jgi:hypothetical protein
MNYVVAGYTIALSGLFVYALSLLARRRRAERAVAVAERTESVPSRVVVGDGEKGPR